MANDSIPEIRPTIDPSTFHQCDLRLGKVVSAEPLQGAKIPAYRMTIDFGPLGVRQSSARLTHRYEAGDLVGRRVVAVLNFPPMRVAGFKSEVLVLGAIPGPDDVSLLSIDHDDVPLGTRIA